MKILISIATLLAIPNLAFPQSLKESYDQSQKTINERAKAKAKSDRDEAEVLYAASKYGMVLNCQDGIRNIILHNGKAFTASDENLNGIRDNLINLQTFEEEKLYYTTKGDWVTITTQNTIDQINIKNGDYYQKLKLDIHNEDIIYSKGSCKRVR